MPKDFQRPEPTKNEKMFYEIAMHLNDLDHRTWSVSSHVLAMGILLNVDPKKMAELLTGDDKTLSEYARKINDEIQKIQKEKAPKEGEAHSHNDARSHDHSHEHDHDHAGHDHSHDGHTH